MIKPEDITIIIPHIFLSKETDYSLKECLRSLDETVPEIRKIVTVNGMKFENDFETVKYPNVEFLVMERQGQCVASNAAVSITDTPWVFITNNDMIYSGKWFERLTDNIQFPYVQCLSPMLIEPRPGAPTFQVEFFGGAGGDFNKEAWDKYTQEHYEKDNAIGIRPGFNLPFLISRDLWNTIDGYDIAYDPWGSNSDSDLEYKIKLAGVQPWQNTNSIVYHFGQTSGTFEPRNQEYWHRNFAVFRDKWGFDRTDEGIWEATFDIPTVEQGRVFAPPWEGKYK